MSAVDLGQIAVLARKEFRDRIRNRWILAVSVILAVFALVITYFGAAQQGAVGVRSMEVTIASLASLVIYLVPLIALLLGFDAVVGERERGSLDLLLSMPITRLELLLGKFLGLSAALACSMVVGFGAAGILLAFSAPASAIYAYAGFIVSSVLLGLTFLSLAMAVSVFAADRARASGAAIALWFFFVLVFDLLLLGLLVASGGQTGAEVFPYLLLLNPADVFRIVNLLGLEDVHTHYGLTTMFPRQLASGLVLGGVMLTWIIAPLALASWRFRQ